MRPLHFRFENATLYTNTRHTEAHQMQHAFYEKLTNPTCLAVLDLVDYYGKGLIITRINVPRNHRGKGIASTLLRRALHAADSESITLFLEISPSDGLNYEQLKAWYKRYGFYGNYLYIRKPKPSRTSKNA